MGDLTNKVLEICNSRYQDIFAEFNRAADQKILISHFGEFSQDLVNSISNQAEEMLLESNDKKGTVKRIFSILVEGLQNIRLHGARDAGGNQASFFILSQNDTEYRISFANLVDTAYVPQMKERIDRINTYEYPELKEHYMEILTNGIISNKGGAGLGFITIAMKSKNTIDASFEQVDDDLSCFIIKVNVQRKK